MTAAERWQRLHKQISRGIIKQDEAFWAMMKTYRFHAGEINAALPVELRPAFQEWRCTTAAAPDYNPPVP